MRLAGGWIKANRLTVINPSNFVGSIQYIGSLFRVDELVTDDSLFDI